MKALPRAMLSVLLLWGLVSCGSQVTEPVGLEDLSGEKDLGPDLLDVLFDAGGEVRDDGVGEVAPDMGPETGWDGGGACEVGCFGDPCTENSDCVSGWCVEHMGAGTCTMECVEECPVGWSCQQVSAGGRDVVFICVSDFANLCKPCASAEGCQSLGGADACVSYGDAGSFCGGMCEDDGDCPQGFSCLETSTVDGAATTQCVADAGECACTEASIALGLSTPCGLSNDFGTCAGIRVCTDQGLSPCDGAVPGPDLCNGLDDDCDGEEDEEPCDDGNPCTSDFCDGAAGCAFIANDENPCDDGDPCTLDDGCVGGWCVAPPMVCDDGNVCTDDACVDGACQFSDNQVDCDDGNPCTVSDECSAGLCAGFPIACDCMVDEDCGKLEDGDLCNGTLVCDTTVLPQICVVDPATVIQCPAPAGPGAACLAPACDPATGGCGFEEVNEGGLCDDDDKCTVAETCEKGECLGGLPTNCNDGNLCTDDTCDPIGGCVHTPNEVPCDDGDPCTLDDQCSGGLCVHGPEFECDDGNVCTDDGCDPAVGCVHTDNLAFCNDLNPCTMDDQCLGGQCIGGKAPDCDDGDVCTTDWCEPAGGCQHSLNTAPCDDADLCTTGDTCAAGACLGGPPLVCDDGNGCTDDGCDPLVGCTFTANVEVCDDGNPCTDGDVCGGGQCLGGPPADCDDGELCTDDSCSPALGCVHTHNAVPCDDGDLCTTGDHCQDGTCAGPGLLPCDDGNVCTDDGCDPVDGCTFTPNDAACEDGNHCTENDLCVGGQCQAGGAVDCDDGNLCTDDSCETDTGCVYGMNSSPCDDGDLCTTNDLCQAGGCVGGEALVCVDGNPCTDDGCEPESGCSFIVNTAPCEDGSQCSVGDVCADGACAPGPPPDCDDGNLCTDDSCDPGLGCVHAVNSNLCDDGDACTTGDLCSAGSCVGGPALDCDDDEACTADDCDSDSGCVHVPVVPCCGNGILEEGEDCDDNNHLSGDGCSEVCACEPDCAGKVCGADGCGGLCETGYPLCEVQVGECTGASKTAAHCGPGGLAWLACDAADYGAADPDYQVVEISCDSKDNDCDGVVDEGFGYNCADLSCTGSGKIHTIPDGCIDDGGVNGGGDSLEVYCCAGTARFCLSGESCPWRGGSCASNLTCSHAGLTSDYMANAWCSQWKEHNTYNCTASGQAYF